VLSSGETSVGRGVHLLPRADRRVETAAVPPWTRGPRLVHRGRGVQAFQIQGGVSATPIVHLHPIQTIYSGNLMFTLLKPKILTFPPPFMNTGMV
jgi:hypothetical protein